MSSRPQRPRSAGPSLGPWTHGPIPVFGVVGGIGSGKSTASTRMGQIGGFVIDADKVGHALLTQSPVRDRVIARFGPAILAPRESPSDPPTIDRKALAKVVFSDPAALRALEAIIHPAMRRTFEKAISRVQRRGGVRAIVLDAAILYEANWDDLCDKVVFIDAEPAIRLARLAEERGWDEAILAAREKTLLPLSQKKALASLVLTNEKGPDALRSAIGREWNSLLKAPAYRHAPLSTTEPGVPAE